MRVKRHSNDSRRSLPSGKDYIEIQCNDENTLEELYPKEELEKIRGQGKYKIYIGSSPQKPTDTEIIKECYRLGEDFIFLELDRCYFIKCDNRIYLLNCNILVERTRRLKEKVIQRFEMALSNENYLFVAEETKEFLSKEYVINMIEEEY